LGLKQALHPFALLILKLGSCEQFACVDLEPSSSPSQPLE
jgi:hypothetical protein